MRRPTTSAARWRLTALLLVAVAAAPLAGDELVELDPGVQQSLLDLQDQWIQWLGAFNVGNAERADELVDNLLTTTGQLGMESLPDLSFAAMARGVEAARQGESERAWVALDAAERLAPGRAETAFARATVHRFDGSWLAAAGSLASGYARLLTTAERPLVVANLALGAIYALLLAGGLFVALSMVVNGGRLMRDLGALAALRAPGLPAALLLPLALVALFWPLLLPGGVAWLVLWWTLLLWTYGSASERAAFAVVWLVVGLSPWAAAQLRERVAFDLMPPVRAVERVTEGELYGGLFADLGALAGLLGDQPAVDHLLADLNRRLGQWDRARTLYRRVAEAEADNVAARIDLGSYYFYKADYGTAIQLLTEASATPSPQQALAYFDLAQAYGSAYYFEEQAEALERARQLDDPGYRDWVDATGEGNLVHADGGYARGGEIRRRIADQLAAADGGDRVATLRQLWSLAVVLAVAVGALLFHLMRRRLRLAAGGGVRSAGRWERILLPGLTALEEGRGFTAFAALLVPVALVVVACGSRWGFDLPLGYAGGALLPFAAAALVLVYALRAWRVLREA